MTKVWPADLFHLINTLYGTNFVTILAQNRHLKGQKMVKKYS